MKLGQSSCLFWEYGDLYEEKQPLRITELSHRVS